jgi:hypothetical protein
MAIRQRLLAPAPLLPLFAWILVVMVQIPQLYLKPWMGIRQLILLMTKPLSGLELLHPQFVPSLIVMVRLHCIDFASHLCDMI